MSEFYFFGVRNLESFLINVIAGMLFFILSVWLVPKFTIRLIRKKNQKYLKQKISFSIQLLCDFFNRMPQHFKPNQSSCAIYSSNLKYPQYNDFVALLKPDLFTQGAFELLKLNLLRRISDLDSEGRHDLVEGEIKRMDELRLSLESVAGIHSNALEVEVINEISQLCLDIRITIRNHKEDDIFEELLNRKEGTFGASHLQEVYTNAFSLLNALLREKGFSKKVLPSD